MSLASPMSMITACPVFGRLCVIVWASRSSAQSLSPGARLLGREVGQLHPVEREIALLPRVAPGLDHQREQVPVLVGAARIRFALVPDRAADAVADHRLEHAVVEVAGPMLVGQLRPCSSSGFFSISRQRSISGLYWGSASSSSRGIQASQAEPPQESWIKPMGTPKRLVQRQTEEIARGREAAHRLWRGGLPRSLEIVLRLLRAQRWDRDHAAGWDSGPCTWPGRRPWSN